jgi:plasmid stabilization system protein ParE
MTQSRLSESRAIDIAHYIKMRNLRPARAYRASVKTAKDRLKDRRSLDFLFGI